MAQERLSTDMGTCGNYSQMEVIESLSFSTLTFLISIGSWLAYSPEAMTGRNSYNQWQRVLVPFLDNEVSFAPVR